MRVMPVVVGSMLIAFGLVALLGDALTSSLGAADEATLLDALIGVPGVLLGGGVALLLFGLTEKTEPKKKRD